MTASIDRPRHYLRIDLKQQRLEIIADAQCLASYPVSTGKAGAGERSGSAQTPRGWHQVRAKIGARQPHGAVFTARRPTGEVYTARLAAAHPGRDWILTRILWLSGSRLAATDSALLIPCAGLSTSTVAPTASPWEGRSHTAVYACATRISWNCSIGYRWVCES